MSWREHLHPGEADSIAYLERRIVTQKEALRDLQKKRARIMRRATVRWQYAKNRPKERP